MNNPKSKKDSIREARELRTKKRERKGDPQYYVQMLSKVLNNTKK